MSQHAQQSIDGEEAGEEEATQAEVADGEDAESSLRFGRADRPPTEDEEAAAERARIDESVAEHYEEMTEIGAEQKGEGRIV